MGSLLRNTWVILGTWVSLLFGWWIFMPVVSAMYTALSPFATGDAVWALTTMMWAWNYWPVILTFIVIVWGVWASTRPDVETSEAYYGIR